MNDAIYEELSSSTDEIRVFVEDTTGCEPSRIRVINNQNKWFCRYMFARYNYSFYYDHVASNSCFAMGYKTRAEVIERMKEYDEHNKFKLTIIRD